MSSIGFDEYISIDPLDIRSKAFRETGGGNCRRPAGPRERAPADDPVQAGRMQGEQCELPSQKPWACCNRPVAASRHRGARSGETTGVGAKRTCASSTARRSRRGSEMAKVQHGFLRVLHQHAHMVRIIHKAAADGDAVAQERSTGGSGSLLRRDRVETPKQIAHFAKRSPQVDFRLR